MNLKKINNEEKIIIALIAVIILFVISFIIYSSSNNKINIYYRVYSNNKWSSWKKNDSGIIVNSNIKNIQIKTKSSLKGDVEYRYYTNKWSKAYYASENNKDVESIYGIKFSLFDDFNNDYQICYKTYNKKNKWLDWSCSNEINGNKNEAMTGIKFKIIPKGVIKNEWLDGYNKSTKIKNQVNF